MIHIHETAADPPAATPRRRPESSRKRPLLAGAGAIAFSVSTVVAFRVANPPGYHYKASNVAAYLAHGHRGTVIFAMYLALFGLLGLICLLAHLRETISAATENRQAANIVWASGLTAAASFAIGWGIYGGQILAHSEGGNSVVIPPPVTHLLSQIGGTFIFGSGATMLGLALIVLALSSRTLFPAWTRGLTLIAGLCGVAGLAYFPFYALLLWILTIGIWLLAATPRLTSTVLVAQRNS
jgi:hypothetical protein